MEKNMKKEVKKVAKKKVKKEVVKLESKKPLNERQRLAKMSPYFASLMDPLNVVGAKIPDVCMIPTGTAQAVQRIQVPIDSTGVVGLVNLVGRNYTFYGAGASDYYVITGVAPAPGKPGIPPSFRNLPRGFVARAIEKKLDSKVASTPVGPQNLYYNGYTKAYGLELVNSTDRARVVSSMLYATYQGSPLSAKGRFTTMFVSGTTGQQILPSTTGALLSEFPIINTYPASKGFCMSRYLPIDETSFSFTGLQNPGNEDSNSYGAQLILLDGGNPGDVVEFTIVENYEFVPNSSQVNLIQATPSYNDPIEFAAVGNTIANDPLIAVQAPIKDILAGSPSAPRPSTMTPQAASEHASGSGFLDSLISGVGKAWDVGSKIAKELPAIAAPLLAML